MFAGRKNSGMYQTTYQAAYQVPTFPSIPRPTPKPTVVEAHKPAPTKFPSIQKQLSAEPAKVAQPTATTYFNQDLPLEQGPINKSQETYLLEKIIKNILQGAKTEFVYDNNLSELFIKQPQLNINENLSLLLRRANLSHLTFTARDIEKFTRYTQNYLNQFYYPYTILPSRIITHDFPKGLQDALAAYTAFHGANELANGLELTNDYFRLEKFLTLCFANVALREFHLHYANKILEIKNKPEKLTDEEKKIIGVSRTITSSKEFSPLRSNEVV